VEAKGGQGWQGVVFIGVGGRFGGGGNGFRESRDLRRCSGGGWRSIGSRLEERDDHVRIGPDLAPKKQYLPFFLNNPRRKIILENKIKIKYMIIIYQNSQKNKPTLMG
jgi:hypothetical protein